MEAKKNSTAEFKVAFITGATIFIMGYMNALALHTEQLSKMVTPQTGNIVWLGVYPVFGQWGPWLSAWLLFFGFVFGCGFAIMYQNKLKNKTNQFFFNWLLFAIPAAIYPFLIPFINSQIAFLLMGLSAGFGVGFFRRMYHLDQINNAMATGSVRFIGVYFAEAFLKKNKKEVFTFVIFVICVLLFALGGTAWAIAANIDMASGAAFRIEEGRNAINTSTLSVTNIVLVVSCIIPMFFAPKHESSE